MTILISLCCFVYKRIRHRILHGAWPKSSQKSNWLSRELDRDMEEMSDESNPAIPGTLAYESRFERELSQDMEDAYRNMNPW